MDIDTAVSMFSILGLVEGTRGRWERKKNGRELITLKYIASVQKEGIKNCIESC
jgi:hypothetical protein